MTLSNSQILEFLESAFEDNYRTLRLEGGHGLTPDIREAAFQQVAKYWEKLRDVAENVTDTEVRLVLPDQQTPKARSYTIEGVVDIVREKDKTIMYDIKTHDSDFVRKNLDLYEKQLNVYAHVWRNLRGQELDETAIIATALPKTLELAIENGDQRDTQIEMEKWNPLVSVPFNPDHVDGTVRDFGRVVDAIEERVFAPPPLGVLRQPSAGTNILFATRICRNCDARFSCSSYRSYATASRRGKEAKIRELYTTSFGDLDRETRISTNVESAPQPEEVD
jgi:hypothetical protein